MFQNYSDISIQGTRYATRQIYLHLIYNLIPMDQIYIMTGLVAGVNSNVKTNSERSHVNGDKET